MTFYYHFQDIYDLAEWACVEDGKRALQDKRTYDIQPTEKAWAVYPFVQGQIDACFQRMTQQMSAQQQTEFKELLLLAAEMTLGQAD